MAPTHVIDTAIDSVTLFSTASLVTRVGEFPRLESAEADLCVRGLPLALDDASVRIGLDGPATWAVGHVRIEIDSVEREVRRRVEDVIQSLVNELELADLRVNGVEARVEEIKSWLATPLPDPDEDADFGMERRLFPLEAWHAFLKTCTDRLEELHGEEQDAILARERLRRELSVTRSLVDSYGPPGDEDPSTRYCKNVVMTVRPTGEPGAAPGKLRISYGVAGAQWRPIYRLLLSSDYRSVSLRVGAQVAQRSGEDWNGALMRFSSARLDRTVQLPELRSRRLGRAQAAPAPSFRRKSPPSAEAFQGLDEWLRSAAMPRTGPASPVDALLAMCGEGLEGWEELYAPVGGTASTGAQPEGFAGAAPDDVAEMWEKLRTPATGVAKVEAFEGAAFDDLDEMCAESEAPPPCPPPMMLSAPRAPAPSARVSEPPGEAWSAPRGAPVAAKMRSSTADTITQALPTGAGEEDAVLFGAEAAAPEIDRDYFSYDLEGVDSPRQRGLLRKVRAAVLAHGVPFGGAQVEEIVAGARTQARVRLFPGGGESLHCVFDSRGRATVPGDGHPHVVDIMEADAEGLVTYRTVPMTDQKVFARLQMRNPFPAPLPGGAAQVFIQDVYAFTTEMRGVGREGTALFPLGAEERIKVSRNTTFRQEEKGLTGGTSLASHGVSIHLRSHMPRAVDVEVIERLPVRDENEKRIETRVTEMEPQGEQLEFIEEKRLRGACRWLARLEPSKDAYFTLDYQIAVPSKMEIRGGNRRV